MTFFEHQSRPMSCTLDFLAQLRMNLEASELAWMDHACFDSAWSLGDYEALLRQPAFRAWGWGKPLQAFLVFYELPGELEILRIGVLPESRRQKLAHQLLEHLAVYARSQRLEALLLEVHSGNFAAQALYLQVGFGEVGRRKGYYAHPPGDALLWRKLLLE